MMQINVILTIHILEFLSYELRSIVGDDVPGDAEPGDDVPHDELHHCGGFDLCKSFSFDPFGEVLGGCKDEGFLLDVTGCIFQGSYDVKGPHGERPGCRNWVERR